MIVAFCGRMGSGKTTAAKYLEKAYGFQEYALALPMKMGLSAMFGLTYGQLFGDLKDTPDPILGVTPRRLLQTLGTEWGQAQLGRDVWVLEFKRRCWTQGHNYAVSDTRFQHELDALRKIDEVLAVRVCRSGRTEVVDHSSEALDVATDCIIRNDSGRAQFTAAIDVLMGKYGYSAKKL